MRSGDTREKERAQDTGAYECRYICVCVTGGGGDRVTERGRVPGETDRDGTGCLSICNPGCNPRA